MYKVIWRNSKEQVLMGARENKLEKLQISLKEVLCMTVLPVLSQFLWNLKFMFLGFHEKLPLVLLQITNYIYSPWNGWKRMRYGLKYLVQGFCPLKIKITQFSNGFLLLSFSDGWVGSSKWIAHNIILTWLWSFLVLFYIWLDFLCAHVSLGITRQSRWVKLEFVPKASESVGSH